MKMNRYVLWFLMSLIIAPAGIVLHEYGHYAGAIISDYSNSEIHFASFSRGDAPEAEELSWKRGIISSGGPFLTLILTLCGCASLYFGQTGSFWIVLGLTAPVRNMASLIGLVQLALTGNVRRNDEAKIAEFFDIPVFVPLLISGLLLVGSWLYLIRRIDSQGRGWIVISIILGGAIGNALWLLVLGKELLP